MASAQAHFSVEMERANKAALGLEKDNARLKTLFDITDTDGEEGWRCLLEYDNVGDGACILDGNSNLIASFYGEGDPDEQFRAAIDLATQAIKQNENAPRKSFRIQLDAR